MKPKAAFSTVEVSSFEGEVYCRRNAAVRETDQRRLTNLKSFPLWQEVADTNCVYIYNVVLVCD